MAQPVDEVRRLIVTHIRARRRLLPHFKQMPTDWCPGKVRNPTSGMYFTETGAWARIAEFVDDGGQITEIILRKPKGEVAYTMLIDLHDGGPPVYVKVMLAGDHVIGRSFHPSK